MKNNTFNFILHFKDDCHSPQYFYCTKNQLDLRIKTEPVTAGANATIYVFGFCLHAVYLAQKPNINRCGGSNSDRLGLNADAEIQIIFGTVLIGL